MVNGHSSEKTREKEINKVRRKLKPTEKAKGEMRKIIEVFHLHCFRNHYEF